MSEKDLPTRRDAGDPVEGFLKEVAQDPAAAAGRRARRG